MHEGGQWDLVGVFEDRSQAESVAREVRAAGVPASHVSIERPQDKVTALRGEMRAELSDGWVSPQGGFALTKSMTKGLFLATPAATAAGAILALPLGFFKVGGLPLWARLLLALIVGAVAGATVGSIVGAGTAEKGSEKPLAAERGVTLRVRGASAEVKDILARAQPIRLDEVASDGTPLATVTTEEQRTDDGVVEDMQRAWREPGRDALDHPDRQGQG